MEILRIFFNYKNEIAFFVIRRVFVLLYLLFREGNLMFFDFVLWFLFWRVLVEA